ncbi:type II toxin-antitoxin system YafQ family toxin [Legionella beliardensis]
MNCREYHLVESDSLLIHKLDKDFIIFERAGTHSDLFKLLMHQAFNLE